jgi:7,8-dihydropterin-6-yl-methyl-4-(beta-D-ribofuranosyl)aminobenzene 5'-phosphate synthase
MRLKLTTLCENTAGKLGFTGEWGLSILVEYKGMTILLDTGLSDSIISNSRCANVDLNKVDKVMLSHGHKDHTGGLRAYLEATAGETEVIAHPHIWQKKYSIRPEASESRYHFIGIACIKEEFEYLGARFHLSREPLWLSEEIVTTGEVPLVTAFENVDENLYVKTEKGMIPDPLMDDQALVIKTFRGLVIVLGCAHHGMINTLIRAREITGVEHIYMVIGGTHLLRAKKETLENTIEKLEEFKVERIGVSHCTGMSAAMALAQRFENNFFFNHAGQVIEIE